MRLRAAGKGVAGLQPSVPHIRAILLSVEGGRWAIVGGRVPWGALGECRGLERDATARDEEKLQEAGQRPATTENHMVGLGPPGKVGLATAAPSSSEVT